MKILAVAIPNHHFFQWINQLENSGHEVCWFDIQDDGKESHRIKWVSQIKSWKLKWDYPLRTRIKKIFPTVYRFLQKYNENDATASFEKVIKSFKPDVIHIFEMHRSGLPVLKALLKTDIPVVYSSWGSDLFDFKTLGRTEQEVRIFLERIDYLITDCKRDQHLAETYGFKNKFLGVLPGNGGIELPQEAFLPVDLRDLIMIKGYHDGVGQALLVLKALELCNIKLLKTYSFLIYSADMDVEHYVVQSSILSSLDFTIYSRFHQISNQELLKKMGKTALHVANSTSDGMPNALLESMGMGAFPIQSNPGKVTEEVIDHGKNGFLIEEPFDIENIKYLIESALINMELRSSAQEFNFKLIDMKYNRHKLRPLIQKMYLDIHPLYN